MSNYYRQRPDDPISHDWLQGGIRSGSDDYRFLLDHKVCAAPNCLNHTGVVLEVRGQNRAYCAACAGGVK